MKRYLVRLTSIAAVAILPACNSLSPRDQEVYGRGVAAIEAKNWTDAVSLFDDVITKNPDYSPTYLGRGRARFELGRHNEALEDLERSLESDDLLEEETFEAMLFKGRCFVEIGRKQFDQSPDDGSTEAFHQRKEARTSFVHANAVLDDALELQPRSYEGLLWRAYCYLRLQNHRRALELLHTCEKIEPGHWEHRFFKALTIEDLYKLNAESLNLYLEITAGSYDSKLAPVYEHLIEIFPKAHEKYQEQIIERLEDYAASTPEPSPQLVSLLRETRERIRQKEREERRRSVLARAAELADRGQFEEALFTLEEVRKTDTSREISDAVREIKEKWSLRLEADAVTLASSEDKEKLQEALKKFQEAQKLSTQVDRIGALQQRINAAQLILTRRVTSQALQKCYALLKHGKFKGVLDALGRVPLQSLETEEKDLYHYLRGIANFKLKRWRTAVLSFEKIVQRPSQDLDLLHGLALVRSGDKEKGVRYLQAVPEERQDDNVHKIMAEYFLQNKKYDKAMVHLEGIRKPLPSHFELRVKVRENLGTKAYRGGDYKEAIQHFVAARAVVERHLDRKAILVYLYLGHSYYRSKDLVRARETYTNLSNTHLTEVEQRRCRDLYLYRARIHLNDREPEPAYRDLVRFARLGGEIPSDSLRRQYAWLLATYADFMPLDRIHHWKYVDTATGKNYRMLVKERAGDDYVVERHEDQTVSTERWSKDGVFLLKTVGKDVWRIPINLEPAKESFPQTEYTREEGTVTYSYKAEIQSNDETVVLPGDKEMHNCIKVRLWRKKTEAGSQNPSFLVYVLYFAPDIGEVKRDVVLNNIKVSEIVLSGFAYTSETLGN